MVERFYLLTWETATVLPWVGRTEPTLNGIQSTKPSACDPILVHARPLSSPRRMAYTAAVRDPDRLTLIFKDSSQITVLFRTAPKVRIAPFAQRSQLLDFGVIDRIFIFDR